MTRVRLMFLWASVGLVAAGLTVTYDGMALFNHVPFAERLFTRWVPPEFPKVDDQIDIREVEAAFRAGGDEPPEIDDKIAPQEVEALSRLGDALSGRLVWSSNRGGDHDLYLADLTTGSVQRLTSNPHVDYFSRFSPDGTQISFLRSRRPWVSFREDNAWDLYLMSADGTDARRLVEHAYHPMWEPDGSGLVFLRDNTIMQVDLATGRERLVQDGSAPPLKGRINDPEIAPDGRLVVTVRQGGQRVGVLDAKRGAFVAVSEAGACHITWMPGEDRVLWVSGEGRGGTRIMHGKPGVMGGEVLIDLPGERSHEYFPRVTNDAEWLVWGATAEGHEHDRADYEIFVWRIGTPWASASRITHSAANDQWPDLFIDSSS